MNHNLVESQISNIVLDFCTPVYPSTVNFYCTIPVPLQYFFQ